MTRLLGSGFWLIAPYAVWMALMMLLPATPWAYAVRTALVAALLIVGFWDQRGAWHNRLPAIGWGIAVGIAVLIVWVLPEQFGGDWYRRLFILGEGGTEAIAESSVALIVIRLLGSALVISVAEELFFRKWLIGFAGFWWMVALFAIQHDRYLVGAVAGIAYGVLYLRKGLLASIIAHAVTNLTLGLWVLATNQWQFW